MLHRTSTGKSTASLPKEFRESVDYSAFTLVNKNSIMFIWMDELEDEFTHSSGLVIQKNLAKDKERWGQVVISSIPDLLPGDFIVVSDVHEPFGCVLNGLEHWMTYEKDVVLSTKDKSLTNNLAGDVSPIKLSNQTL